MTFPRDQHTYWLSSAKMFSPENIDSCSIVQTEQDIFMNANVYIHTYMCTVAIKKKNKGAIYFEGGSEGIYESAQKEESEGRNVVNSYLNFLIFQNQS